MKIDCNSEYLEDMVPVPFVGWEERVQDGRGERKARYCRNDGESDSDRNDGGRIGSEELGRPGEARGVEDTNVENGEEQRQ